MNHQLLQTACHLPIGSLDAYMHRVNQCPMLSAEEEHTYATQFQLHGDIEAARCLVLAHLRYVVRVARGYLGYGLPLGDLIQEGSVGLMKAVKRFDPNIGVRLVSFAVHWIKAEIHEFVLKNWRIVKIATTKAQRKLFFNLRQIKKRVGRLGWFHAEEVDAVARDLGVTREEVLHMEQRLNSMDASFDTSGQDSDDDDFAMPANYLHDPGGDPAFIVEREQTGEVGQERLMQAFEKLDARSQDILQKRWLSENKSTLHDLAAIYSVSAERVRQLEKNAMKKLRNLIDVI